MAPFRGNPAYQYISLGNEHILVSTSRIPQCSYRSQAREYIGGLWSFPQKKVSSFEVVGRVTLLSPLFASVMLYPSSDSAVEEQDIDPNWYPPFKSMDSTLVKRVAEELDELGELEDEGLLITASAQCPLNLLQHHVRWWAQSQRRCVVRTAQGIHRHIH